MMRWIVGLCFITLCFFSCKKDDTCLSPQQVSARAGFKTRDSADNLVDSTLAASRFILPVQDSLYIFPINKSKALAFLLSSASDSTQYIFQSDTTTTNPSTLDTLTFIAERNPVFVSVACGFQFNFLVKQVLYTKNTLDSVWIASEKVDNNANTQHVHILLHKL